MILNRVTLYSFTPTVHYHATEVQIEEKPSSTEQERDVNVQHGQSYSSELGNIHVNVILASVFFLSSV